MSNFLLKLLGSIPFIGFGMLVLNNILFMYLELSNGYLKLSNINLFKWFVDMYSYYDKAVKEGDEWIVKLSDFTLKYSWRLLLLTIVIALIAGVVGGTL